MASRVNLIEKQPPGALHIGHIPLDEMLYLTLTIHSLEFMNESNFEAVLSRHICLHRVLLRRSWYSILFDQVSDSKFMGSDLDGSAYRS